VEGRPPLWRNQGSASTGHCPDCLRETRDEIRSCRFHSEGEGNGGKKV